MGRRSKSVVFSDFSGGLNIDDSPTSLQIDEAIDLDNIVLLPRSGFEKRNGNSSYNSSAMSSGAAVHGLGYYRQADGDEFLMSICGTKIFKSEFDGTMDDISAALTITSGQDNIWIPVQMNDLIIFVGGNRSSDVPIKYSGSGNAAVLAGSPPVGSFAVMGNNRLFIMNTIAAPSRIYWSILGNPEDFSGTGSGTQDVAFNDGDQIVGAILQSTDHLLLFKQNSIHDLVIRTSPFPLFPLFSKTGAISPRGIVDVDGIIYFITPEPRMKATDGTKIVDFPSTIDSVWDSLNKTRLPFIRGVYDRARHLILWFCSTAGSATNDFCIVWDLYGKAWLKFSSGHNMNEAMVMRDRILYGGGYEGKVYELNDDSVFNDASETSTAIDAYYRSGWMDLGEMINMKHIPYVDLNFTAQQSGTFDFSYGFDFDFPRNTVTISMQQSGALWDTAIWDVDVFGGTTDETKLQHLKGNGKFFQYRLRNQNSSEGFKFNRLAFPGKLDAPLAAR